MEATVEPAETAAAPAETAPSSSQDGALTRPGTHSTPNVPFRKPSTSLPVLHFTAHDTSPTLAGTLVQRRAAPAATRFAAGSDPSPRHLASTGTGVI